MTHAEDPQGPQDAVRTEDARIELPLRGVVKALPVAAVVVTVMWGYTVFAVVDGGNNAALSGTLMSALGLLLLFVAVTYVGYLVRPLTLGAGPDGVSVRLPLLAERTIAWDDLLTVRAVGVRGAQFVIVEARESARGTLPYVSRPRAAYRRLSLMTGSAPQVKQGLCFETYVFAFAPEDVLRLVRTYAPPRFHVEDQRR
ncbi:hypothetical protein OG897_17035 [Streptomyces sp. NBC_00237]|uniref:hypothetical protein n=1 Tax=Streptomyces sp. NBC_00237 TaxID=2975687 RepID=UPI0022550C78|nr:hypothetical protein [Streptomyces sp. NBC_00237]MCX5203147.1 hypothetical protein [Streptomyces sp. NBC_00237]